MITDLTKDQPNKIIWRFALPMIISIIFQQMYNISDSVIAGKCISENALAAVGASFPVTMLFMQVANGANAGCAVIISQFFGAKNNLKMKAAVSTSMISSTVLAVILTVLGIVLCKPILLMLKTPDNIFKDSAVYLNIYFAGLLFVMLYNICNGIFTALGDSKTPLYFLIASSVGNVILNLVFVLVFDMGVAGLAWATFIAQGIAAVFSAITLYKRLSKIKITHKFPLYSNKMLKKISFVAVPSILQNSFVSVGGILIQGIINDFGSSTIAGFAAATKLNIFAVNCIGVISNATASFSAQNIGAGKYERVPQGYRAGLAMEVFCIIPFMFLFFYFPNFMVNLFMDEKSSTAVAVGAEFLRWSCPFYVMLSIKLISDGVLRSAGAMRAFMSTTFLDLFIRVALSYILAPVIGFTGVCISWPAGWIVSSILSYFYYKKGFWKRQSLS